MKMVVSFADNARSYAEMMKRLEKSLYAVGFDGVFKGYTDYNYIASPHHRQVPYAFKAHAIRKAIEEMPEDGERLLLWCDSPIVASKSIEPVFDYIREHGYMFFDNIGFNLGEYTGDACLNKFGMDREESFGVKIIMACCMAFDLNNKDAADFLQKYIAAAMDGVSYMGDWNNDHHQVSTDNRCKGTRHDQSVASIIIHQSGLDIINAQNTFFAYNEHKGKLRIAESVCLWR